MIYCAVAEIVLFQIKNMGLFIYFAAFPLKHKFCVMHPGELKNTISRGKKKERKEKKKNNIQEVTLELLLFVAEQIPWMCSLQAICRSGNKS